MNILRSMQMVPNSEIDSLYNGSNEIGLEDLEGTIIARWHRQEA
jgi:hypothetical protein